MRDQAQVHHVARRRLRVTAAVVGACIAGALLFGASAAAAGPTAPTPPLTPTPLTPSPNSPATNSPSVQSPTSNGINPITPIKPISPTATSSGSASSSSSDSSSSDSSSKDASVSLNLPGTSGKGSNSVVIILLLTVISIAPSLLVLCTSFTRIVIVLSLTRNALGLPSAPPQQVIVGLSVFLTLFVMGPTLTQMKNEALDPLMKGDITTSQAYEKAQVPLREFLMKHTREGELKMFLDASKTKTPVARDKVPLVALVPAFVLSELKSGFIIGFVIFIPFLIIDLVVSAVLMGLGMMMLPPSFISLPFKLLLFIMLDGWMLVVGTLLKSYG